MQNRFMRTIELMAARRVPCLLLALASLSSSLWTQPSDAFRVQGATRLFPGPRRATEPTRLFPSPRRATEPSGAGSEAGGRGR